MFNENLGIEASLEYQVKLARQKELLNKPKDKCTLWELNERLSILLNCTSEQFKYFYTPEYDYSQPY